MSVSSVLTAQTLPQMLAATVRRFPDRPAIDFFGRCMTYRAFGAAVEATAAGLQDRGIGKGDRVGLCLPNCPAAVIFYQAVLVAGGVAVSLNPLEVEAELEHQLRDSGAKLVVVPDLAVIYDKIGAVADRIPGLGVVVCSFAAMLPPLRGFAFRLLHWRARVRHLRNGRDVDAAQLAAPGRQPVAVAVHPADLAVLQYTGGTTGPPKGAMLTHAAIAANCRQILAFAPFLRPGEERVLGVLPLFHVFAMTVVMNLAIVLGAEMILLPRFDLKPLLRVIARRRPTLFPGVPTLFGAIAGAGTKPLPDLTSVRFCICGAAPLSPQTRIRFEALTGCRLLEGYGLTEASPVVSCNPPDAARDGTVGVPLPETEIAVLDTVTGARLTAAGARGEIVVRGPQVMAGYWRQPEETAAALAGGWLHTGDVGCLDADGYLTVVDRLKDVIFCGGYNVYPSTIEAVLRQHPAVAEAAVVGVPDSYRGEAPLAFVVLKQPGAATAAEIEAFVRPRLSPIDRPRAVELRASLPMTLVGKPSRRLLAGEARRAAAGPA